MIEAVFYFDQAEVPVGFSIEGHAGYEDAGKDIVCASVSSPAYMVANTITEILRLTPEITVDEQEGFLKLLLTKKEERAKAKELLEGFFLHLESLSQMYADYIQVERGAFNA